MIYLILDATNYPVEAFMHEEDAYNYLKQHDNCRVVTILVRGLRT